MPTPTPWHNTYLYARMLINRDRYGAVGKNNKTLTTLCQQIENILNTNQPPQQKITQTHQTLTNLIQPPNTNTSDPKTRLLTELAHTLTTLEAIQVFHFTAKHIVLPTNQALETIPNSDNQYTQNFAHHYLNQHGETGIGNLITLWDDIGFKGCLEAERHIITTNYTKLREKTRHMPPTVSDQILTTYTQEFERRLGQKRKTRAGYSLENAVSFLLNYFHIPATHTPHHFQTDFETDKWLPRPTGWLIGISCKRTLRDRWKHVSGATQEVLTKHRIAELWHIITYDTDLTPNKIEFLGKNRHIFYLQENSHTYLEIKNTPHLQTYVRPLTQLIQDSRTLFPQKHLRDTLDTIVANPRHMW